MTAGVVAEKMSSQQFSSYVAGIVEGLAYARFQKDGKDPIGMGCIYDWFYKEKATIDRVEQMFRENPDYPPGAVVAVMAEAQCGE